MDFKKKVKLLVSKKAFENLCKYVDLIEQKNKVINLTGFSGNNLWKEGIYESIFLLNHLISQKSNLKILDIGSGVGFPLVPYLIVNPNNQVTIYEPMQKRVSFLNEVKKILKLNLNVKRIRSEDASENEHFDFITARAVAPFKILAEISHHLLKINGTFIFLKGPKAKEEIQKASWIIKQLKIRPKIKPIKTFQKENLIITYLKEHKTPSNFPRKWKKIKSFYA